jgi:type II secretory pathway component GspD/PulD (secretin)
MTRLFKPHTLRSGLSLASAFVMLTQPLASLAATALSGDVHVSTIATQVDKPLLIRGSQQVINMALRGVPVADALRALAKKGGFNVAIDASVTGILSEDFFGVTIRDALDTIKTQHNLVYAPQNNTLMVAVASSDRGKSFKRSATNVIPLQYGNARVLATLLNNTVFAETDENGQLKTQTTGSQQKVTPDPQTNSLIVVGSQADVDTVREYVQNLDLPRESRTWRLSHANALDVATQLASTVFNDGVPIFTLQQSGGAAGGAGGGMGAMGGAGGSMGGAGGATGMMSTVGNLPTTLRVRSEDIEDGDGGSTASTGGTSASSSSSSSSSGSSSSSSSGSVKIRGYAQKDTTVQITPQGPLIVPDTRMNTITVLGTAEQVQMAESIIPVLDRKVPQVVLETSLVEITDTRNRELGFNAGFNNGRFGFGFNNTRLGTFPSTSNPFSQGAGVPTSTTEPLESILNYTSRPIVRATQISYQINALIKTNRAKLLANPTIMTSHGSEAVVSIVDEIIKSVVVTANSADSDVAAEANIGEVGIILNILPTVGANGTISMRVRPTVSTVGSTTSDRFGNTITLLSKREALAQNVVLEDGQSFVLGGLIQDTNTHAVGKVPGLADLPIVGALMRSSTDSAKRSELVIVVTPHIMREDDSVAMNNETPATWSEASTALSGNSGMKPVSYGGSLPHVNSVLPALEPVRTLNTNDVSSYSRPVQRPSDSYTPGSTLPGMTMVPQRIQPEEGAAQPASYLMHDPAIDQAIQLHGFKESPPASARTKKGNQGRLQQILTKYAN